MRQYKAITIILSGIFIAIIIIVGINVLAFSKKQVSYEVDSNYTSKVEISDSKNNEALIDGNPSTTANNKEQTSNNTVKEDDETTPVNGENNIDNEGQSLEVKQENVTDEQGTEEKDRTETDDNKDVTEENTKKDVTDNIENKQPSKEEQDIENKKESHPVTKEDKGGDQGTNDNNSKTNEGTETDKEIIIPEDDFTGHEWVDDKIEDNREDIEDTDLEVGLYLGDKIDDDILLGFLEDGLTEEEKVSLQEYLEVVLTPEEYDELNVLFERYNHMFQ